MARELQCILKFNLTCNIFMKALFSSYIIGKLKPKQVKLISTFLKAVLTFRISAYYLKQVQNELFMQVGN